MSQHRVVEEEDGHHSPHDDEEEEEMGVLNDLCRLTNDDIFGECLRFLDHAQAEICTMSVPGVA